MPGSKSRSELSRSLESTWKSICASALPTAQFRGVAENARGDSFDFQFTSADWESAIEWADIALVVEVEAGASRKQHGPWSLAGVTLAIDHDVRFVRVVRAQ
jgi:hypothetical protein